MTNKNRYHVEFEQGYYKEIIEKTLEQYMEDGQMEFTSPVDVHIAMPDEKHNYFEEAEDIDGTLKENWIGIMKAFQSFYGPETMQVSVRKDDALTKNTDAVAMVSRGIAPYLSRWSPYHGALYTVVLSLAKSVACGGDYRGARTSFVDYYEKETEDSEIQGRRLAALLGAYEAKKGFGLADLKDSACVAAENVFGKDHVKNMAVQPDFCAVTVNETKEEYLVTPDFKKADNKIIRFCIPYDKYDRPIYEDARRTYKQVYKMIKNGYIQAAYAVGIGGTMEALAKMCQDRDYGVRIDEDIRLEQLSQKAYGAIVAEIKPRDIRYIEIPCMFIGEVLEEPVMEYRDEVIALDELFEE